MPKVKMKENEKIDKYMLYIDPRPSRHSRDAPV